MPCYKTFYGRNLRIFVPAKSLWVRRAGAYPRVEHLKCASLGHAQTLHEKTPLGRRGLAETNTLAYYNIHKLRL